MPRSPRRAAGATRRDAGFTLIELLVVLAILGCIVALVTPQVLKYLGRAKIDAAHIEIQNIGNALDLYRLDMSRYPTAAGRSAGPGPGAARRRPLGRPLSQAEDARRTIPGDTPTSIAIPGSTASTIFIRSAPTPRPAPPPTTRIGNW